MLCTVMVDGTWSGLDRTVYIYIYIYIYAPYKIVYLVIFLPKIRYRCTLYTLWFCPTLNTVVQWLALPQNRCSRAVLHTSCIEGSCKTYSKGRLTFFACVTKRGGQEGLVVVQPP
jgi:hypothetical protein